MRTLRFFVEDQIIRKDPKCNFEGIVPGTQAYLKAEFIFSPDWEGFAKVAAFRDVMGREYTPQLLKNNACMIPTEALRNRIFTVQALGRKDNETITTNKVDVHQNGGRV